MRRLLLSGFIFLCLWMPSHSQIESDFVSFNDQPLFSRSEVFIKAGRTMVPAKKLFDALHIDYYVDLEKKYLQAHNQSVDLKINFDENIGYINDEIFLLNVSGEIRDHLVYVPLRFVSEAFGADVLWLEEEMKVSIDFKPFAAWQVLQLLESIEDNSQSTKNFYALERQKFKEILLKVEKEKAAYLVEEKKLLGELIRLGLQVNVKLKEDNLKDMMASFHGYWKVIYEKDKGEKPWVYEDDYYFLSFDEGYYYGFYKNYQAHGYRFGYTSIEDGYILSLVPYRENKRQGIGYKAVYNHNHSFLYDMFYKMDKNVGQGLEYVRYENGLETFDRSDKRNNSLVYIDDKDHVFIPPLKSETINIGYYQWSEGLEYVGYFYQKDRLGRGMYFDSDDTNFEEDNLLKQRSLEILQSLALEGLSQEDQIKKIHNYLTMNIRYDDSFIPNAFSHTAYGALILGQGVCDGYAESFKYLLDIIGIENHLIFGTVNGQAHAWNLVKIKDQYFHFDLTWNDDDKGQVPVYTYYKRNSEFFKKTHQWDYKRYEVYLGKDQ